MVLLSSSFLGESSMVEKASHAIAKLMLKNSLQKKKERCLDKTNIKKLKEIAEHMSESPTDE